MGAKGGLTIGQHPQPSSDYEEDYVIGIRRPEFRGAGAPLAPLAPPPGSATQRSIVPENVHIYCRWCSRLHVVTLPAYIVAGDNMCRWATICIVKARHILSLVTMCRERWHILSPATIYARRQYMLQQPPIN